MRPRRPWSATARGVHWRGQGHACGGSGVVLFDSSSGRGDSELRERGGAWCGATQRRHATATVPTTATCARPRCSLETTATTRSNWTSSVLPRAPVRDGRVVVRLPSSIKHGFVGFGSDFMDLGMNTDHACKVFGTMPEPSSNLNFLKFVSTIDFI